MALGRKINELFDSCTNDDVPVPRKHATLLGGVSLVEIDRLEPNQQSIPAGSTLVEVQTAKLLDEGVLTADFITSEQSERIHAVSRLALAEMHMPDDVATSQ